MKNLTLAIGLFCSTFNAMSSECELNSRWEVLNAVYSKQIGLVRNGDYIDVRHEYDTNGMAIYNVYLSDGMNERLLCGAEEITDVITTELSEYTNGSYPRISCAFYESGELMQLTLALVKDGFAGQEHCANDFYGYMPDNQWFQFKGEYLAMSCNTENACALYWNVRSLDYTINEDEGSGSGGNDGGTGSTTP